MDVKREWRKEPPRERLETLEALVRDFKWRFPRERRDMVVEFCRKAPDLETAIVRAVLSKDESGKHHNHQSKINRLAYEPMIGALRARRGELHRAKDFDSIFDFVETYAVEGWGEVGVYDIATRIAAFKGLEPSSLYLHAGVRIGWYALLETIPNMIFNKRAWAPVKRVPHHELPAPLQTLTADEAEDFLCTYRSVFAECLQKGY